jgi:glycine/D-amino acid oxidase-like deaminating enzyme
MRRLSPRAFSGPSETVAETPRRSPPQSVKILVLGAGILGTATAWYAARDGHEVTVVERQPGAALETSFANGGQISVGHAVPWANPAAPAKILRWLGRADAPLRRAGPRT